MLQWSRPGSPVRNQQQPGAIFPDASLCRGSRCARTCRISLAVLTARPEAPPVGKPPMIDMQYVLMAGPKGFEPSASAFGGKLFSLVSY